MLGASVFFCLQSTAWNKATEQLSVECRCLLSVSHYIMILIETRWDIKFDCVLQTSTALAGRQVSLRKGFGNAAQQSKVSTPSRIVVRAEGSELAKVSEDEYFQSRSAVIVRLVV